VDTVAGMLDQTVEKIPVRSAVPRLKRKDLHENGRS
jgi:hypothetical protein